MVRHEDAERHGRRPPYEVPDLVRAAALLRSDARRDPEADLYPSVEGWIAKLDTVVHELYHIDPDDVGIRSWRAPTARAPCILTARSSTRKSRRWSVSISRPTLTPRVYQLLKSDSRWSADAIRQGGGRHLPELSVLSAALRRGAPRSAGGARLLPPVLAPLPRQCQPAVYRTRTSSSASSRRRPRARPVPPDARPAGGLTPYSAPPVVLGGVTCCLREGYDGRHLDT